MSIKVWIDGKFYPKEEAKVSVYDHGLLYGDGVFEGIRAYHGKVFRLKQHVDRLYASAKAIWLEIPMTREQLAQQVDACVKENKLTESYIRVVVTRGFGDLGLDPRKCPKPTVIVIADTIQLYPKELYDTGLAVVTAATPISHRENLNPRIKSLNYLAHILAKIEGIQAGVHEVIMLDHEGYVAECSGDNIFTVTEPDKKAKGKKIVRTTPANAGILKGITRDAVIELAEDAGYDVREETLTRYDLYTADEFFLTGTGAEIISVVKADGRVIGDGKPGPVTKDLLGRFRELAKSGG
ncbi:MAG: branched-chain-amino-acid transaminase [Planctomycetes bacterium]|nr:branched-chain-amino-acid transaminase [Planctomycetota bacterium]